MNLTLEQLLLLEQSGELSPEQQRQLDADLAASPEARQQRTALQTLAGAIPPVDAEPAPDAAARIVARLQAAPAPAPRSRFRPVWKPALAAAAALALLLGVRAIRPTAAPESGVVEGVVEEEFWADPFEADFAELDSLIAEAESDELNEFMAL
jgi:anti-sigma factor RsiW